MKEKRLYISDYWFENDLFVDEIVDKAYGWVNNNFLENIENITISCIPISGSGGLGIDMYLEISFNDYKLINGYGDECSQTIGFVLSEHGSSVSNNGFGHGLLPFYDSINKEFFSKYVYEVHTWSIIQGSYDGCVDIYGLDGKILCDDLCDYVLTC